MPGSPTTHRRFRCALWTLAFVAVALSVLAGPRIAAAQSASASPQGLSIPDELLVGFQAGLPDTEAQDTYLPHGAVKLEQLRGLSIHRIRVPAAALTGLQRALRQNPKVKFVEPNWLYAPNLVPNDPSYPDEWHLQKIYGPQAWDISQGASSVIVAILDSGVDPTHPDLAAKLVPGYNFWDNNTNTADVYGHGTMVAGAAAAISNNGSGVASVAWENDIMPIRVAGTDGYASTSAIANGLTWAVDHGAKVMNLSFGGVAGSSTILSAAQYVVSRGGVVVAAAGNCGCFDSTAPTPYLISVSATDGNDSLASWSSQGNYVDVSAPGVSILTTTMGGGYAAVSGTSFSSPITAGVVALMMSVNPTLSPSDITTLLETNADDLGASGWDQAYGYGRVNAYRAVAAAAASISVPDTTPPTATMTSPATGSTLSGTVTVAVAASDNTNVARVDLYIDGAFYGSDTTSPYGFSWDTSTTTNGPHTLTANAIDSAGNVGTSATVTVTVSNVVDTTAPTVAITSTSMSSNKLVVSVAATDNVAVAKVELYVDGKLVGTKTAAPYTYTVNLNSLALGTHTVQAKAYDNAGNTSLSAPVSFTKAATNGRK